MSDWDIVKKFVSDRKYTPEIPMDSYIACILLHYEGDIENEETRKENGEDYIEYGSLENWLSEFNGNYRMEDFDYE